MEQLDLRTVGLLGLIILAVVWMIVRRAMRRQRVEKTSAQLGQEAGARGWTAESSLRDGAEQHVVEGQSDGIAWKLVSFDRPHGGGRGEFSESHTEWRTKDVSLPGAMVVMVDAPWRKASGVSRGILSGMVEKAIDAGKGEKALYKQARPVESGSEALRKRYFILALPGAPAERFLSEGAEAALLEWSGKPKLIAAVLWEGGVVVEVMDALTDAADCERLAGFGVALAKAARGKL